MLWIFYTILGALLQSFRNLQQKVLNKNADVLTTSWARFILPFPIAILVVLNSSAYINNQFVFHCFILGLFQILGNICMVQTLKSRNFSIGIAFFKTEVLQTLIIGLIFFNQFISIAGFFLILLTGIGVLLMSNFNFKGSIKNFDFSNKAVIYGLASGFFFSITAFHLKFAAQNLNALGYSKFNAAMLVLLWSIFLQNILFAIIKTYQKNLFNSFYLLINKENRQAFFKIAILSFVGSIFWFLAFAIGNVIYVKAVGQIEMVFALLISHFYLKEKHSKREFAGIFLTIFGIVSLILIQ
jgi:uncharacterized membrane protein